MSDIVDQIEKLKDKAHKLKEGVSNNICFSTECCVMCRGNTWRR